MRKESLSAVIQAVMNEQSIETSSDWIVVLWAVGAKVDSNLTEMIRPIYQWEYDNWHDSWESNVRFIERKMKDLTDVEYDKVEKAYTSLIDYMITDPIMTSIYKLDRSDPIGWKIFKELSEKRRECKKLRIIAAFQRTKNV